MVKIKDGNIEIIKGQYAITVDMIGNIVEGIHDKDVQVMINNLNITLEDGNTKVNDNSQLIGTKLIINFDPIIENGKIIKVEPEIPYLTNGSLENVEFTIVCEINGKSYTEKYIVNVASKYMKTYESLFEAVNDINSSGFSKLSVYAEGKVSTYDADIIYYSGNLDFNGTIKNDIDNIIFENNTYILGDLDEDVATSRDTYAKNTVILKVDGDVTISPGINITTVCSEDGYGGPKGLLIYATGKFENNGKINMTQRGAHAEGQDIYLWKNSNGTYEYISKDGGKGFVVKDGKNGEAGENGYVVATRATGGGGAGGGYGATGGSGTQGNSYSGGSGGGAGGTLIIYSDKLINDGIIESKGSNGGYGADASGGVLGGFGGSGTVTKGIIKSGDFNRVN